MTNELESRLRAARPRTARVDENAFDAELLARVRDLPIARRRTVPRTVAAPVAAGVALTATAVVMLGGGPGDVGGPSAAAAVTQTLHWLTPPAGTILHVRSVETQGGRTTTRELWQSADHPGSERLRIDGANTFETSGEALYDPATDTIYDAPKPPSGDVAKAKRAETAAGTPVTGKPASPSSGDVAKAKRAEAAGGTRVAAKGVDPATRVGDPMVDKVRTLLQAHQMVISGREVHNGTDTWAISLKPDAGRPVWTLWVSTADGKPVELRDPGRDASEQPQVIRWPTYEVLPNSGADQLLTLTGAHPSAHVVHDAAQTAAARQRLESTITP